MKNILKSITTIYKKSSNVGKVLFFLALFIVVNSMFKTLGMPMSSLTKEGYTQDEEFVLKTSIGDIYDKFYADIYDFLVYSELKDDYEIGEIINKTSPTSHSRILDIGSGTGHHVGILNQKGFKGAEGVDISPAMVAKAKEMYPESKFKQGDIMQPGLYIANTFTHILCLYFTIYYMNDKETFFKNCYNYLMPDGYLVVGLVDKNNFDPMLPPANPFAVSLQKHAPKRITTSKIKFNKFDYSSNFKPDGERKAIFEEKFEFKETGLGPVRKQEHTLYMENSEEILSLAQDVGFIFVGKIDLANVGYEHQYLYVLKKSG